LPNQQQFQGGHGDGGDKFWQLYRGDAKSVNYPDECTNFRFEFIRALHIGNR
jgi:hypothetical protein